MWVRARSRRFRFGAKCNIETVIRVAAAGDLHASEATRERVGPHYWDEATFSARLGQAGFTVLDMRRTFLGGASLLVWARKSAS